MQVLIGTDKLALYPFTTVAEVKLLDIPNIHTRIHKLCPYGVCFSIQLFPTLVEYHMVLAVFSNGMYWVGLTLSSTALQQVVAITYPGTVLGPGTSHLEWEQSIYILQLLHGCCLLCLFGINIYLQKVIL